MLFWVMLDIMKHVKHYNPNANFLIENVKMKKEFEQYITTHTENALGHVHKILINSALVSAQNRNRYYWTSFEVEQPEDKGILLKDIIEHDVSDEHYHTQKAIDYMERGNEKWMQAGSRRADRYTQDETKEKSFTVTANIYKGVPYNYFKCGSMICRKINPETGKRDDYNADLKTVQRIEIRGDEKTGTLTTVQKDNVVVKSELRPCELRDKPPIPSALCHHVANATDINANESNKRVYADTGKGPTLTTMGGGHREPKVLVSDVKYRKLTPRECFRLQTVPEHHIDTLLNAGISNTQLYKMCGNGWTMKVIRHIFKGIG